MNMIILSFCLASNPSVCSKEYYLVDKAKNACVFMAPYYVSHWSATNNKDHSFIFKGIECNLKGNE